MRSLIFDLKRSDQSHSFFLNGPKRVCPQLVSLVPDRLERKPRLGSEPRGGGRPSANPHLFLPSTTFETLFPTPVPTLYLRWRGLRGEKWSHYAGLLRPRLDGPDKVPLPPLMAVLKDVGKGEKRERKREMLADTVPTISTASLRDQHQASLWGISLDSTISTENNIERLNVRMEIPRWGGGRQHRVLFSRTNITKSSPAQLIYHY